MQKKSRPFRSATILPLIASLLFCIACNVSENNRFYFATSVNGQSTLGEQYLTASSSFQYDFAGEETIRSTTSSYSNVNHSLLRTQRNNYQSHIILAMLLVTAILILTNNLRSYGYHIVTILFGIVGGGSTLFLTIGIPAVFIYKVVRSIKYKISLFD